MSFLLAALNVVVGFVTIMVLVSIFDNAADVRNKKRHLKLIAELVASGVPYYDAVPLVEKFFPIKPRKSR